MTFSETLVTLDRGEAVQSVRAYNAMGIPAWFAEFGSPATYVIYTEDMEGKPF